MFPHFINDERFISHGSKGIFTLKGRLKKKNKRTTISRGFLDFLLDPVGYKMGEKARKGTDDN